MRAERWQGAGNHFLHRRGGAARRGARPVPRLRGGRRAGAGRLGGRGRRGAVINPDGRAGGLRQRHPHRGRGAAARDGSDAADRRPAPGGSGRHLDDGPSRCRWPTRAYDGRQYRPTGSRSPARTASSRSATRTACSTSTTSRRYPLASRGRASSTTTGSPSGPTSRSSASARRTGSRMRVWERGVGETQACGSGACAAAVAAVIDGRCQSPVAVAMPGGEVEVAVGPTSRSSSPGRPSGLRPRPQSTLLAARPRLGGLDACASRAGSTRCPSTSRPQLARRVAEARAAGVDVISLGVGDPDLPAAGARRGAVPERRRAGHPRLPDEPRPARAARGGGPLLRHAASAWSSTPSARSCRCSAPRRGSPTCAWPSSTPATPRWSPTPATRSTPAARRSPAPSRCGCRCCAEHGFLPDLDGDRPARRASGPTCCSAATRTTRPAPSPRPAFFERLAAFGLEHGVPICHDNAYAEITYDGLRAPSFLAAPGAREAGIEVLSLSKALNMPGWRVAFAVGNAAMVGNLTRSRPTSTPACSRPCSAPRSGARARSRRSPRRMSEVYARRRDLAVRGARGATASQVEPPRGRSTCGCRSRRRRARLAYAERLLPRAAWSSGRARRTARAGEGYVRLSLTVPDERLAEAMERLAPHL